VGTKITLRCPICGWDRAQHALGLAPDGSYDAANAHENDMTLRIDHFLGRGRIVVERHPVPLATAYGLRDALRAALARVEADIAGAGG
jgi:hypothetical protein